MKRIRRIIQSICRNCLGTGHIPIGHTAHYTCPKCAGSGNTESVVWEFVHDEEDEQAHAQRWAGATE